MIELTIGMTTKFMHPKKMNDHQPMFESMIGMTNVVVPQPMAHPRMV